MSQLGDRYLYPSLNVQWYGALGDGIDGESGVDDTDAIQACIDAAQEMAAVNGGATVRFPAGVYRVSRTIVISSDGITLEGEGPGGDTGTAVSMLTPAADFADDSYVLSFANPALERTLSGVRMRGIRIGKVATLANTVHGIYLSAYRSIISDVQVQQLSGSGIALEGYSAGWQAYQNKLSNIQIQQCALDGLVSLGDVIELHVTDSMIHGNRYGWDGGCTGNRFTGVHFWGNTNNVRLAAGGVQPQFANCSFRESTGHNFLVDATAAGASIVGLMLSNCNFRQDDGLAADETYDNLIIMRSSGGNTVSGVVTGCVFLSAGDNDVRYHINLSGAVSNGIRIGNCRFDGNAVTAKINHPSNADLCLLNNLGINVGDPASTGDWNGSGEEGIMVVDTGSNTVYLYANGAWRPLNGA